MPGLTTPRLRTAIVWALIGIAIGAAQALYRAPDFDPSLNLEVAAKPGFSLLAHDGAEFTERNLAGRHVLLYFGYTNCPDVCPIGLYALRTVLNELGDLAKQVLPVFVTLDPQRDSGEVMAAYVRSFHPDIIGVTGEASEVARAAKAFNVVFSLGKPDQDGNYPVSHSVFTYFVAPSGKVLRTFPHGVDPVLAADIIRNQLQSAAS